MHICSVGHETRLSTAGTHPPCLSCWLFGLGWQVVRLLLSRGADPTQRGRHQRTPLMNAPVSPLLRALAFCGVLGCAYGATAWFDCAPGGWRLRSYFEDPSARSARSISLHILERLRAFAAEEPGAARGAVLFLGSSTVERWPTAETFPNKRVLDHGLAGISLEREERLFDACLPGSDALERVVDTHVHNLRRKLEQHGVTGVLVTVRAVGYRFQ